MSTVTYPLGILTDDSGAILAAPVVVVTSVVTKAGAAVASHGATVNGSGTATPVSVDYDPEAKGEAWISLAISQVGSTVTGQRATHAIYASRDSSRIAAATSAAGAVLDMTAAVPQTGSPVGSVGEALVAARAQGFGRWTLVGNALTLYGADDTTIVRTFTLDNPLAPTLRA